jgi:hypothetical protein
MRRRFLPIRARIFGGLIAVFAIWLLHPRWLPGQLIYYLFVGQAVALYAFIGFQASVGPMPAVGPVSESEPSQDDSSGKEKHQ